jgi:hypothetical protein
MSSSPEGACAPRDRRRVAPHLRWEGAKMAELHFMEMGWSGSGWMDPLPMENTPAPNPASTPSSYGAFEEPTPSRPGTSRPRRKSAKKSSKKGAKKAARKAGRSAKRSARKSARKGRKAARKAGRVAKRLVRKGARKVRKAVRKAGRSAKRSARKSARKGRKSSRK